LGRYFYEKRSPVLEDGGLVFQKMTGRGRKK